MQTKNWEHKKGSGWAEILKKSLSHSLDGISRGKNSHVSASPRRQVVRSKSKISPALQEKSTRPPTMHTKKSWQPSPRRPTLKNSSVQSTSWPSAGAQANANKAKTMSAKINQNLFHFKLSFTTFLTHIVSFFYGWTSIINDRTKNDGNLFQHSLLTAFYFRRL